MEYLKDSAAIYQLSEQRVREAITEYTPSVTPSPALIRMVHACADPSIAEDYRCTKDAESIGKDALLSSCTILCDCTMVQQGIIQNRLAKNTIRCTIGAPEITQIAHEHQTTRSAAAVHLWTPYLTGSIVVIGNAPTALFQLLENLQQGAPKPALIIGMPVGFVGAQESKLALTEQAQDIPYMTLLGKKGGSAIAAAALNSLAGGLGS